MNRMKRRVIQLVRKVVNKYASTTTPTFDEICSGLGLNVVEDALPSPEKKGCTSKKKKPFLLIRECKMKSVNDLPNFMKLHII